MTKSKAIIFDLDDTLYAERDYVRSGFRAVAGWAEQTFGIAQQEVAAELCQLADSHPGNTFDQWLSNHQLPFDAATITEMVTIYRDHIPLISSFPAVPKLLGQLGKQGYAIGLVSDGFLSVQQAKFAALEIGSHFQAVVFSDALGRENWKPATAPFEWVLQQLQVEARAAVYVGDNPTKDFIGPRKLGMKSVRLRTNEGVYQHLEAVNELAKPDFEITKLDELVPILSKVFR